MECKQCGAANSDDARFCADCGTELSRQLPTRGGEACFSCGAHNPENARFCASCGIELNQHERRRTERASRVDKPKRSRRKKFAPSHDAFFKRNPAVVVLAIFGIVALIAFASGYFGSQQPQNAPQLVEVRSDDPAIEVSVMEIASKFICSCGACGGLSLDECTCNRAIEERQFIRNYLQGGQTADQVMVALNNTFGWMKPEFDTLLATSGGGNAKPGRISVSNDILEGPFLTAARPTLASKLATVPDRVEIFSHFECPCGQCGINELKECECSHPRGAKEVKAFIDKKITEGKYTIADLISEVEKTYGGRKF